MIFTRFRQQLDLSRKETDKFKDFFLLLCHWLEAKNYGGSTVDYFRSQGYKSIAIYGMGDLANRLYEDLEKTEVKVQYGIDRDVCNTISRISQIYALEDSLEEVDAVVVTPFYAMGSIKKTLEQKVNCPIISLEEVVWSI